MKKLYSTLLILCIAGLSYGQKNIFDFSNIIQQTQNSVLIKSKGDSVVYPPAYYVATNQFVTFPVKSGDLTQGFICGTNVFGDLGKAQKFKMDYSGGYTIKGFGFWIGSQTSGTTGTLVFKIYNMTASGPGTVLASKSLDFSTITKTGFVFYALTNPVKVTADYAIGAEFQQMGSTMFSFVSTQNNSADKRSWAWELQSDNKWYQMSNTTSSWGLDADMMFAAVIDGSSFVKAPTSTFTLNSTGCVNKVETVTYTGDAPSTAAYNWDFGDAILIEGEGQGPMKFKWATEGTKTISLIVVNNSVSSTKTEHTIQINTCDAINDLSSFNGSVNLYPNPASETLTIDLTNSENKKIVMDIINLEGQKVYTREFPATSHFNQSIDISYLQKGVYYAYFKTDTSCRVEKLVIN